jgi:hypothetical protein
MSAVGLAIWVALNLTVLPVVSLVPFAELNPPAFGLGGEVYSANSKVPLYCI